MDTLNEEFANLKFACVTSPCSHVIDSTVPKDDGAANLLKNKSEHSSNDALIKDLNLVEHYKTMSVGSNTKKMAPTVPPKPQKNLKLPESDYSLSNNVHLLHRKQSTLGSGVSHNKLNAFSLDNPAILEQQLEALAHHKMQLERKGILQKVPEQFSTFRDSSNHSGATKEFSSSFPNDPKNNTSSSCLMNTAPCPEYTHTIYSNICTAPILPNNTYADTNSFNTYTNVTLHNSKNTLRKIVDESKPRSSVDHNTHSKKYSLDDLSSPLTALNIGTDDDYIRSGEVIIAPSPVSSSYSELHRATDIFSKMPVLTTVPKKEVSQNSNNGVIIGAKANSLSYPKFNENLNSRNCDISIAGVYQNYTNENVNFNDNLSLQCVQRISQGSSDYYGFGSFSQGSSTYESIYEPINPRPSSQLSAQSNCLMYPQYANSPQTCEGIASNSGNALSLNVNQCNPGNSNSTVGVNSGFSTKNHIAKEPEMQSLTDFLVDSTNDVYSYGVCVKCNERVLGENSGCTAMDQVYHISCFTCTQCQVNLQGKPFYALECKPYCEYDYLQTLEKCSICMKPILERILRATGKPYHPQCFTCVVCGNSLDGIPFTVDAINQNYCIADFHKKFAPRCCVCEQPIMPEPGQEETIRVVALDRSFHFDCYKCEDCGLLLSSEAEGRGCYPLDDHVLCKSCNAKRVQLLTTRMTTEL